MIHIKTQGCSLWQFHSMRNANNANRPFKGNCRTREKRFPPDCEQNKCLVGLGGVGEGRGCRGGTANPFNTVNHTRRGAGWGVSNVSSLIRTHQSLCFCRLEHIPWILLGFVPHNLQHGNGPSPAAPRQAGPPPTTKTTATALFWRIFYVLSNVLAAFMFYILQMWLTLC